jgi:hypothetical protein
MANNTEVKLLEPAFDFTAGIDTQVPDFFERKAEEIAAVPGFLHTEDEMKALVSEQISGMQSLYEGVSSSLVDELDLIDMDGAITMPDGRDVTYREMAERGKGWKLHLNFDPDNLEANVHVKLLLRELRSTDSINFYKIGHGGGRDRINPGKEATVYVGHRDSMDIIAPFIEEQIGDYLDPETESTLKNDIMFGDLVAGRFENTHDREFAQYGDAGLIYRAEDWREVTGFSMQGFDTENERIAAIEVFMDAARKRAETGLIDRYGVYFTGVSGDYTNGHKAVEGMPFDFLGSATSSVTAIEPVPEVVQPVEPFNFLQK